MHQQAEATVIDTNRTSAAVIQFRNHYETLLARLYDIREESGLQTVGLTSCVHGEGVSTISANLAVAAADAFAGPVLLIEAGSIRPSIRKTFRVSPSPGLAAALSRQASLADCIRTSPVENLSVLEAGPGPSEKSGAFHPGAITEVLAEMREAFELVIVDLPPTNQPGPYLTMAGKLDGVLLIIEAERVQSQAARRAKQQLWYVGAELLGVVFNKRRATMPRWLSPRRPEVCRT